MTDLLRRRQLLTVFAAATTSSLAGCERRADGSGADVNGASSDQADDSESGDDTTNQALGEQTPFKCPSSFAYKPIDMDPDTLLPDGPAPRFAFEIPEHSPVMRRDAEDDDTATTATIALTTIDPEFVAEITVTFGPINRSIDGQVEYYIDVFESEEVTDNYDTVVEEAKVVTTTPGFQVFLPTENGAIAAQVSDDNIEDMECSRAGRRVQGHIIETLHPIA